MNPEIKKYGALFMGGLLAGIVVMQAGQAVFSKRDGSGVNAETKGEKKIKYWTCSMHPQIKMPEKGLCPICGMDLIPVYEGDEDDVGGQDKVSLTLNETARRLAEVETAEVVYKEAVHEVRLVGKVDYDETRLAYISAWIDGRIDRLYVDFTGIKVRKGDHLIKLYSPELLAAQEEYLQAIRNLKESRDTGLGVMRQTAEATLKSAREKLRLYGIDEQQVRELERRGKPREHMIIRSPVSGTVIHKKGFEGMYVKTGDRIYTIADLSRVWLFLEAYERDIPWLHYGQSVVIEAESFPGRVFRGKIAFIEPFVNEKTRTIKLRVNIDNPDEQLKPGMFVRAIIKSVVGEGGRIYEANLAGKWICPMHPDVVKDRPGTCDLCGMSLIETSKFGFINDPSLKTKVLVVPKTAVLITGKRAVVYVENPDDKSGVHRYEGREVVLGPTAGDNYIVLAGLKPGERVVVKGNFKIDSDLQIQAKPSMMNPKDYYTKGNETFSDAKADVQDVGVLNKALAVYLRLTKALAQDDERAALAAYQDFRREVAATLDREGWSDATAGLGSEVNRLAQVLTNDTRDIKGLRRRLREVSTILKGILTEYPYKPEEGSLFLNFCPMALGKGGYWLQDEEELKNPYYGNKMLGCGETKKGWTAP